MEDAFEHSSAKKQAGNRNSKSIIKLDKQKGYGKTINCKTTDTKWEAFSEIQFEIVVETTT